MKTDNGQLNFLDNSDILPKEITGKTEEELLPIWGLPKRIQEWITKHTEVYQCDRNFFTISILMATAVASGKQFRLNDGKYKNYPVFYVGIVASQRTNKTTPIAFAPIEEYDKKSYNDFIEESNKLKLKERKLNSPTILIKDTTPEFICTALVDNPDGSCILRDELDSKFAEEGRYNKSNMRQMELTMWSGSPYSKQRATQPSVRIDDPCLSIFGSIQPGILAKSLRNGESIDSGYVSRWLWVFPKEVDYPEYDSTVVDRELSSWYNGYIQNILDQRDTRVEIGLNGEALELYKEYFNQIQNQIRESDDEYDKGILSKLQIYVLRYALNVFICRHFASNEDPTEQSISAKDIRFAIESMEYFFKTSLKVKELITLQSNERNPVTSTIDKYTNKEIIVELNKRYTIKSKQALADALGVSRPSISKMLSSEDKDVTK